MEDIKISEVQIDQAQANKMIASQLAECSSLDFVSLINPLNEHKPICRTVHRNKDGFFVYFKRGKCQIVGGKITTIDQIQHTSYYISF